MPTPEKDGSFVITTVSRPTSTSSFSKCGSASWDSLRGTAGTETS